MSQLPVYSPVTLGALLSGGAAILAGGRQARHGLLERLHREYAPQAVLLTDSGTSALRLALEAAGGGGGSAPLVALPAYGCFDLGTAAVGAGRRVIFYDVVPETLGPDWLSLEHALALGAGTVVLAHWYGVPVDVERAMALAARTGAVVVDDAAQGVGATIGGRPVGAFGDLGVLSFGRGKGRTGGGGGALLANTARGAELLERVRPTAASPVRGVREAIGLKAQWLLGRPSLYWIPASLPFLRLGDTPWHDPSPARGIPAFAAGALVGAWQESGREVSSRRAAAAAWRARYPDWRWPDTGLPHATRGELRLPVLATTRVERDENVRSIPGAMPGYPLALPDLPQLQGRIEDTSRADGARALVERLWTLPCHRWVRP